MRYLSGALWIFLSMVSYAAERGKIDLDYGHGGMEFDSKELARLVGADNDSSFHRTNSVELVSGERVHRYSQQYLGIPVYGTSLAVKELANGQITSIYGRVLSGIDQDIKKATTKYDEDSIQKLATKGRSLESIQINSAKWIYQDENGDARIFFLVSWFDESEAPTRPHMIFDADTAELLQEWEGLATKDATGPGGNTKTGQYYFGKDFGYLDVSESCAMTNDVVDTHDMKNATSGGQIHTFPCSENTARMVNGAYSPLNDGHYFAKQLFNMYMQWYGIRPLGQKLVMRIHYGQNYENAFWDGQQMTFGDGGSYMYPLVDINVTGHEVSHGFTEQNSNLMYWGQSGGINEAFSDMAGEALEYYIKGSADFLVGPAIMKKAETLRYMADPTKDGRSIGHADGYYFGMDPHFSSGVFNRAFYNIATASGYDVKMAFDLFVLANQVYWNQMSDYADAACGVYKAAKDKGYPQAPVYDAFKLVGLVPCG